MKRRLFLKSTMASSVVATAISAGLLTTKSIFADVGNFKAKSDKLTANIKSASSGEGNFKFKAPKIAENGAVVPLTVDASKMKGVTNIAFLTEKSATPLSSSYALSGGALGFVSTRIKMGQTSPVTALVTANGSSYAITKEVKVTIGGCGG